MNIYDRHNLQHPRPTLARAPTAPASLTISRPKIKHPNTPYPQPPPRPSAPPPIELRGVPAPARNGYPYRRSSSDTSASPSSESSRGGDVSRVPPSRPFVKVAGNASLTNDHLAKYQHASLPGPQLPHKDYSLAHLKTTSNGSAQNMQPAVSGKEAPGPRAPPLIIPARQASQRLETPNNVHFTPDNIFVSLTRSHTLKLYNLTPSNNGPNSIIRAVRNDVVSLWKHGVKYDREGRGEWSVRFKGSVWRMRGDEAVVVRRMICQLFSLLSSQGYSYLCSVQNTRLLRSPRHLFTSSPPRNVRFFMLSFSLNRRKLTFIDIPSELRVDLSNALRHTCPFAIDELEHEDDEDDVESEDSDDEESEADHRPHQEYVKEVYTVRLRRHMSLPRSKRDVTLFLTRNEQADMLLMLSTLLKVIASHGYRLDASVPLGRARPLGLRGRREVWIFKSVSWRVSPTSTR